MMSSVSVYNRLLYPNLLLNSSLMKHYLSPMRTGHRLVSAWFLEIIFVHNIGMCMCLCVTQEDINNKALEYEVYSNLDYNLYALLCIS